MAYIQTGIPKQDLQQILPKLSEVMQDLNEVWQSVNDDDLQNILSGSLYPFNEDFESVLVATCKWVNYCMEEINKPTANEEREFIVKDNSGRGGVNTVTESFVRKHFENILYDRTRENEDDDFYDWLTSSDIGDVYGYDNATVFTRIK